MTCSTAKTSPPLTSFSYEPDLLVPGLGGDQESRSPEFEFSVSRSFERESSADELFSSGMILPLPTAQKPYPVPASSLHPVVPATKKDGRSFLGGLGIGAPSGRTSSAPVSDEDADFSRKSVFCSFPLLPRSNSTGSTKRAQRRQPSIAMRKSLSASSTIYGHSRYQKDASVRSQGHHTARVSPLLNVLTACTCEGTASFLGLGSWLHGDKDKKSGRR